MALGLEHTTLHTGSSIKGLASSWCQVFSGGELNFKRQGLAARSRSVAVCHCRVGVGLYFATPNSFPFHHDLRSLCCTLLSCHEVHHKL